MWDTGKILTPELSLLGGKKTTEKKLRVYVSRGVAVQLQNQSRSMTNMDIDVSFDYTCRKLRATNFDAVY
jgi:hypothetical protein